jgi:hypothetical protein
VKFPHFKRLSRYRVVPLAWSTGTTPVQPMSCWYCGAPGHGDTPCPQRVRDAYRFAAAGAQLYPPRPTVPVRAPDVICELRLLEEFMLTVADSLAALQGYGPTPAARGADLAGAAATVGEWARQIELGRGGDVIVSGHAYCEHDGQQT